MSLERKLKLGQLKTGSKGIISRISDSAHTTRLLEMGFIEGSLVEILHEGPFGKDPIAVKVRGTLVALRRSEANLIEVVSNE